MLAHLRANLWLLVSTVILCCVLYPLAILAIGQTFFHDKAQGSFLTDAAGKTIGSSLIAQPFTQDQYFQPRPSAASFNGAASGCSNLAGNNYQLRDRVARQIGPIATYASGLKKGQLAAPDIESWFQKDQFGGKAGIVAQWANAHSTSAQNWVKADKLDGAYVEAWEKSHEAEVTAWKKDNPDTPEPKPEDLAVLFFASYAKDHPGTFPSIVDHKLADGKSEKRVEPVKDGSDIQSIFFDMWLTEHADADLTKIPGDMVTTSGSGLDPHITLDNALWQLDRVAPAWAKTSGGDPAKVRKEIEDLLHAKSTAPLNGLIGVPLVNVLEMNLALEEHFKK